MKVWDNNPGPHWSPSLFVYNYSTKLVVLDLGDHLKTHDSGLAIFQAIFEVAELGCSLFEARV